MKLLFIHQNFPGQFRHLLHYFGRQGGDKVTGIGEPRDRRADFHNVRILHYEQPAGAGDSTHQYLRSFEANVRRGQKVANLLLKHKERGYRPDVICVHPGWGESLYIKDIYPDVPLLNHCEFYYSGRGVDVNFDPEFPSELDVLARTRTRNATMALSLLAADAGVSPTRFQRDAYPAEMRAKIHQIHEGINTVQMAPDEGARFSHAKLAAPLTRDDEVITFVNRSLEPYRGFHIFMRALPEILRRRPNARVLIVGSDDVSYGIRPKGGGTYRQQYLKEVKPDLERVHFLGRIPYRDFGDLLKVSRVHIYLTYPFVLSWSLLEAMSCGCAIVGSRTAPVEEVIEDRRHGLLVDFFSSEALAQAVDELARDRELRSSLGAQARQRVVQEFDLRSVCLPRYVDLIRSLAND